MSLYLYNYKNLFKWQPLYIFMTSYSHHNSLSFSFPEAGNCSCVDMIIYVDNSVTSRVQQRCCLHNQYAKVSCICVYRQLTENECFQKDLLNNSIKNLKYLRINLTIYTQDPHGKNFRLSQEAFKEILNKWSALCYMDWKSQYCKYVHIPYIYLQIQCDSIQYNF